MTVQGLYHESNGYVDSRLIGAVVSYCAFVYSDARFWVSALDIPDM